jgi:hypothetical protein
MFFFRDWVLRRDELSVGEKVSGGDTLGVGEKFRVMKMFNVLYARSHERK